MPYAPDPDFSQTPYLPPVVLGWTNIGSLSQDPPLGNAGDIYWNTTSFSYRYSNGVTWYDLGYSLGSLPSNFIYPQYFSSSVFSGTGTASTVARSDHSHSAYALLNQGGSQNWTGNQIQQSGGWQIADYLNIIGTGSNVALTLGSNQAYTTSSAGDYIQASDLNNSMRFKVDRIGNVTSAGTVTAASFVGNGSGITGITMVTAVSNTASNGTFYPVIATGSSTNATLYAPSAGITFNPSSGTVSATQFSGGGSALTSVNSASLGGVASANYARRDVANTLNDTLTVTPPGGNTIFIGNGSNSSNFTVTSESALTLNNKSTGNTAFYMTVASALTSPALWIQKYDISNNLNNLFMINNTGSVKIYGGMSIDGGTANLGSNVATGSVNTALNSASLAGNAGSYYAPIDSPNFTTNASVVGNRIITTADKFTAASAAVASSELISIIIDETGSGNLVFNTSPTFAGTVNLGPNVATGSVATANNSASLGGIASSNFARVDTGASFSGSVIINTLAQQPLNAQSSLTNVNAAGGNITLKTTASSSGTSQPGGGNITINTDVGGTGTGVPTGGSITISTTQSGTGVGGPVVITSASTGTINNMTIGATTPASAKFTSASTSGSVIVGGSLSGSGTASFSGSVIAASFGGNGAGLTGVLASISVSNTASNGTYYPVFVTGSSTNATLLSPSAGITINPSTNTITATNFTGIASSATNLGYTTASPNTTNYIPFVSNNTTSTQAASVTASFSINPSLGVLSVPGLSLSAGTTSRAPIIIASGTNLGTASQGAIEFDADKIYFTQNATVGRGNIRAWQHVRRNSTASTTGTSLVAVFDAANDTLTLEANKYYEFEALYSMSVTFTAGTAAGQIGFTFSQSPAEFWYMTEYTDRTVSATPSRKYVTATTATTATGTLSSGAIPYLVLVKGAFKSNATTGGTLIPGFCFTGTPGSVAVLTESYFRLTKLGAPTDTNISGAWA